MRCRCLLLGIVGGLLSLSFAQAQTIRESDVVSLAGTLQKTVDPTDEYEVSSTGNQVLFVDLDADLYINREQHADAHDAGSAMEGGCATDGCSDSGGTDEGCGGGGPGGFVLEVLNDSLESICYAARPTKPGWDTDPRMACLLPERGTYILKVAFAETEPHAGAQGQPKVHPYLLNVSLRELAEDVPGLRLETALKASANRLHSRDR